ncbi:MAG: hypothetical protein ABJ091_12325 [Lentilitoribacter sp.]
MIGRCGRRGMRCLLAGLVVLPHFVAHGALAHDSDHTGLFKGGLEGDTLDWAEAVKGYNNNNQVIEIATGQVIKFSNFPATGEFYSVSPDGQIHRQGYSNQIIVPGSETAAWLGRDCLDFEIDLKLVFKPQDSTIPEQSIVVRKHTLNTDGTLPEPWPKGVACIDE